MKFTVTVNLEHVSGPEQDEDTLVDYFAGTIGRENGARPPLTLTVLEGGLPVSTYVVALIDA